MFLAVKMLIKKLERSHTCDLTAHFKVPQEKKHQTHPRVDVRKYCRLKSIKQKQRE